MNNVGQEKMSQQESLTRPSASAKETSLSLYRLLKDGKRGATAEFHSSIISSAANKSVDVTKVIRGTRLFTEKLIVVNCFRVLVVSILFGIVSALVLALTDLPLGRLLKASLMLDAVLICFIFAAFRKIQRI